MDELIALGNSWLPAAGAQARATFLIALGFKSFWLRQSAGRAVTDADVQEALANVKLGLALAEQIDDAQLISAALDGLAGIRPTIGEARSSWPGGEWRSPIASASWSGSTPSRSWHGDRRSSVSSKRR